MSRRLHLRLETPDGDHDLSFGDVPDKTLARLSAARGVPLNTRCGERGLCAGCEARLLEGSAKRIADGAIIRAPAKIRTCLHKPVTEVIKLAIPPRSLLRQEPEVVSDFRISISRALDPWRTDLPYGVAVDIGTTTVALLLVDLRTGDVVADASAFNAQVSFGEDVLTRIEACARDSTQLVAMQRAVTADTIQPLLKKACDKANIAPAQIGTMTVAANTTMLHLLAGEDPAPMGIHPFTPGFLEHRTIKPGTLGLAFGDDAAEVHLLPGAAAYVGADIAAGVVATGMLYDKGPSLLVDVGTNGEIVAKVGDRILGCATAAGPAFEGAGLMSGVRAVRGAIERVRLQADPFAIDLSIIGGKTNQPVGICGSAYIDFLSEGRRVGLLQESGRFTGEFADRCGDAIETGTYGRRLILRRTGASGKVCVSELDVARLLQAKAAIAAGIQTLLGLVDRKPSDIKTLYLAGGFGMHLSLNHAIDCGLLPGFRPEQISVVGNTSLAGAMLTLTDKSLLAEVGRACDTLEEIELNLEPGFEDAYIDNLMLDAPLVLKT